MNSASNARQSANEFRRDRIRSELSLADLIYEPTMGSTNDVALKTCRETSPTCPFLVLTSGQREGRGRGGNKWFAGPGSLTFSLVLQRQRRSQAAPENGLLSLHAGAGICRALQSMGLRPLMKWPNDVMLHARKLAGTLIETVGGQRRYVVIGCGINANNSLAPELGGAAISLSEVLGEPVELSNLLVSIVKEIQATCEGSSSDDAGVIEFCRHHNWLAGKQVDFRFDGAQAFGEVKDIGPCGGLVIEHQGVNTVVRSGSVKVVI